LFKDSSLNVLSPFTHSGDLKLRQIFQSSVPLAHLSLLTTFLSSSSVQALTLLVNSSKNRIELSLALSFNGCAEIPGNANSLEEVQYHNILFSIDAIVDLPLPVIHDSNTAGAISKFSR
jgi:hypothetical protein